MPSPTLPKCHHAPCGSCPYCLLLLLRHDTQSGMHRISTRLAHPCLCSICCFHAHRHRHHPMLTPTNTACLFTATSYFMRYPQQPTGTAPTGPVMPIIYPHLSSSILPWPPALSTLPSLPPPYTTRPYRLLSANPPSCPPPPPNHRPTQCPWRLRCCPASCSPASGSQCTPCLASSGSRHP